MKRLCSLCLFAAASFAQNPPAIPLNLQRALDSITPANLKGDLSFLASDALKGRYTPSPELDIAAEFIASQFRAAGLEPGGNQDYFQTAEMIDRRTGKALSAMTIQAGGHTIAVPAASIAIRDASQAAKIDNAPVLISKDNDPALLRGADVTGKAILVTAIDFRKMPREQGIAAYRKMRAFEAEIASSKAAL